MLYSRNDNITETEDRDLKSRSRQRFTDIHCHCLAGLDDGPSTTAESLALCQMLAIEGFATVVATPHQLGRFGNSNDTIKVKKAVQNLTDEIRNNGLPLQIVPGGEVRVDERICQLLKADEILTLADGGKYLLIELPYQVFIDIEPLLAELASMNIQSVIAHAELISPLAAQPELLQQWFEYSTHLQITAASLAGDFGSQVKRIAWDFLSSGKATLIATDSHDTNFRRPKMRAAYNLISTRLGEETANLVCIENPARIVKGQDILSVSVYQQQKGIL